MNDIQDKLNAYKNAISAKQGKPAWLEHPIKTHLSKNITTTEWNAIVEDIRELASDDEATSAYVEQLTNTVKYVADYAEQLNTYVEQLKTALSTKSKAYIYSSFEDFVNELVRESTYETPSINIGDTAFMFSTGTPDFVVIDNDNHGSYPPDTVLIPNTSNIPTVDAGAICLVANKFLLLAIESGVSAPDLDIDSELDRIESIAKGANQAISFSSYEDVIEEFNKASVDKYRTGQNVYVLDTGVPDLWVSGVVEGHSEYYYTNDQAIVDQLYDPSYEVIRVGHYYISALETQKVDLTEYATKDEVGNIVIKQVQFTNGDTITVANNTIFTATEPINALAIEYPSGDFICGIQFTLADEGDITISLPTSEYIGETPTFSNGETWELNIRNGVVVGGIIE